jgi:hypothetical protein
MMGGSWRISFVLVAFLGLSSTALADADPTAGLRVIRIPAEDVGALNRAVNDPANVSTVLVLEPGVYQLGPDSQDAQNGGRLELQENQFIQGTNRYVLRRGTPVPRDAEGRYADPATEAILDCSLVVAPGPAGCVMIWRGGTSRVTIRDGATAGALVQVGIATRGSAHSAFIFRTDLVGGQRAVRIQHNNAAQAGIASTAVVSQSILRDSVGFFAFGWQVQIAGAAAGASIDVLVENSTITRTRFGGFVAGLANGATFTIRSVNNLYQDNHLGLELDPARDAAAALGGMPPGISGNLLDFTSDSDRFVGNGPLSGPDSPTYWPTLGAISAKTAFRTAPTAGQHSGNTLRLTIKDPVFRDNSPIDLSAYAAVSLDGGYPQGLPGTELAGLDNVLELSIDAEHAGSSVYCDSIPADPEGTNQVIGDTAGLVEDCLPFQVLEGQEGP